MIGIIGAMSVEIDGLVAVMDERETISCGAYKYELGKIYGKEVVVCRCGIGKVFSATATALMIEKFSPDAIINIGVAGGAKPLCQGDIVVSKRTVQHDYDGTADGLKMGQVHGFDSQYFECDENLVNTISKVIDELGYPYKVGTVATGDCFVSDNKKSAYIASTFDANAFDMESGAINQVCVVQNVPFVALRAISDNGDDSAMKSFYEFVTEAATRSINIITKYIQTL
ncbi:MAG: 5'-methylthioadenosine/adenosylhomocysteine nucleosidase [Clostridia bacterium]|nr:5'-methylthioadenosine/adenosylhomocysteine nucleosidase [Clostridia bacterium]